MRRDIKVLVTKTRCTVHCQVYHSMFKSVKFTDNHNANIFVFISYDLNSHCQQIMWILNLLVTTQFFTTNGLNNPLYLWYPQTIASTTRKYYDTDYSKFSNTHAHSHFKSHAQIVKLFSTELLI